MRQVFVGYNHTGHACRFRTRLSRSEREGLEVGDVVLVVGDAMEPREARVVQMTDDGREAELEFLAFSEPLMEAVPLNVAAAPSITTIRGYPKSAPAPGRVRLEPPLSDAPVIVLG